MIVGILVTAAVLCFLEAQTPVEHGTVGPRAHVVFGVGLKIAHGELHDGVGRNADAAQIDVLPHATG